MATIPSNFNFPTSKQIPDHAIMDFYNKQAYLGNQYVYNSGIDSLGDNAEHPFVYLSNPAGNTVSLFCFYRKFISFVTTNYDYFRIYSNPTGVSGGTAKTPANCRFASGNASSALVLLSPSTVSNGTLIKITIANENTSPDPGIFIIDPGQSMLITIASDGISTNGLAEISWYEL